MVPPSVFVETRGSDMFCLFGSGFPLTISFDLRTLRYLKGFFYVPVFILEHLGTVVIVGFWCAFCFGFPVVSRSFA